MVLDRVLRGLGFFAVFRNISVPQLPTSDSGVGRGLHSLLERSEGNSPINPAQL